MQHVLTFCLSLFLSRTSFWCSAMGWDLITLYANCCRCGKIKSNEIKNKTGCMRCATRIMNCLAISSVNSTNGHWNVSAFYFLYISIVLSIRGGVTIGIEWTWTSVCIAGPGYTPIEIGKIVQNEALPATLIFSHCFFFPILCPLRFSAAPINWFSCWTCGIGHSIRLRQQGGQRRVEAYHRCDQHIFLDGGGSRIANARVAFL